MPNVQRRRRFKIPVLSRLTVAWLGAFGVLGAIAGGAVWTLAKGYGPGRVSLPVEGVEMMARAEEKKPPQNPPQQEARLESPSEGVRLGAPSLRDGGEREPMAGAASNDTLSYPAEFPVASNEEYENEYEDGPLESGDIVITIPGGASRAATAANAASLTPVRATPIASPDPALMRSTPFGKAPQIGRDGRKPMQVYAHPYDADDAAPKVAVIVGGLGLNEALTERAIDDLPPEVSLAFAPYAKNLDFWAEKARNAGHEVLIELPMEGYGGNPDALGAAGLLSSRTEKENLQRLDWLLSRFEGYFAVTNYMGAKFSTEEAAIGPVLEQLRQSGVAYFDDTGAAPVTGRKTGATIGAVARVIPPAPDESQRSLVRRELATLEQVATRDGAAIGKTYAYAATIDELIAWSNGLEGRGVNKAPASALLRSRATTR